MKQRLVRARDVSKSFVVGRGWGKERRALRAVHQVNLELCEGESLGLVGESGCGKSTLARMIVGLESASAGTLELGERPYPEQPRARQRLLSRQIQMVFQDPKASLNPRKTGEQLLRAPLAALTDLSPEQQVDRARELLELVELAPDTLARYPHQLSGGQAQRLCIARALGPRPKLLVLDEAVSSLDVSIQARILRLLHRLRRELGLSYLFIAHDLAVVEVLCDQIAVMYLGSIVEMGPAESVLRHPKHPYTRALLSAVPVIGQQQRRLELKGEPPSPAHPPPGCVFHTRCYRAEPLCSRETPRLGDGDVDRPCACFFAHDSEPPLAGPLKPD